MKRAKRRALLDILKSFRASFILEGRWEHHPITAEMFKPWVQQAETDRILAGFKPINEMFEGLQLRRGELYYSEEVMAKALDEFNVRKLSVPVMPLNLGIPSFSLRSIHTPRELSISFAGGAFDPRFVGLARETLEKLREQHLHPDQTDMVFNRIKHLPFAAFPKENDDEQK